MNLKGRFRSMTDRIEGSGIPSVGQKRFSDRLRRACGCVLLWNRRRRVFVIARDRGSAYPRSYMDLGREHFPLNSMVLRMVINAVRWADARLAGNFERLYSEMKRAGDDRQDEQWRRWMDQWFPDYVADMKRYGELLNGRTQKVFDMAT